MEIRTEVVICGAGPAGLTLAHLLGAEGVEVTVLEKLDNTVQEPRAIAIDGESLRTLQRTGLLAGFEGELLCGLTADYVNGEGELLFQAGQPERRPYGFSTVNSFDQPALDRYLAESLSQRESVSLCFGHTLEGFEQDEQGVRVRCTDAGGNSKEILAHYLVGCDGGRSTIRAQLGITMSGESNSQPWLVIDTVDPHLDNESDCRFFCDPRRPGMTIRKQHGERRWEWMLMPGEKREFLLEDSTIRELIAPYTDVERVDIYRKRVYDFHAIMAERWRDGRVFLAGDAAHMTPPFAGQGLNSGFRDVANLSWKLAAVVQGRAAPSILDSYEPERRDHAWELIDTALELGRQIQPIDAQQAAERDTFFAAVNQDPAAVEAFQEEMFKSILERSIDQGLVVDSGTACAGRLLIQPELATPGGGRAPLDEYLGGGFALLGFSCNVQAELGEQDLAAWSALGATSVNIASADSEDAGACLLDLEGEFADWLGTTEPRILLVRPDRFCMVSASPADAAAQLQAARLLLAGGAD